MSNTTPSQSAAQSTFLQGLKVDFAAQVSVTEGADYLPWAAALALAGRPQQSAVSFDGQAAACIFNGAAVAIDMALPNGKVQTTFLPVLNPKNEPIPVMANDNTIKVVSSRDINDARNRARAKAVAMVQGVGLALYAGFKEPKKFLEALAVDPSTDLASVKPMTDIKKGANVTYLSWAAALAAARITDPEFHWEVVWNTVTTTEGEVLQRPFCVVGRTFAVEVKVVYKGRTHIEFLPIMGVQEVIGRDGKPKKMDNQALYKPTVADWNKAVMRCLTKAIAVSTGYGINIYAKEDEAETLANPQSYEEKEAAAQAKAEATPISKSQLESLKAALAKANRDEASAMAWFGKTGELASLNQEEYGRLCQAMKIEPVALETNQSSSNGKKEPAAKASADFF